MDLKLASHASCICSTNKLLSEINTIKRFASCNEFPKSVANSIIDKTLNVSSIAEDSHDTNEISNKIIILCSLLWQ